VLHRKVIGTADRGVIPGYGNYESEGRRFESYWAHHRIQEEVRGERTLDLLVCPRVHVRPPRNLRLGKTLCYLTSPYPFDVRAPRAHSAPHAQSAYDEGVKLESVVDV